METILKQGSEYLKGNPQTFLKVNSIFKRLNFKEVNFYSDLRDNLYCNELTLFINPKTNGYGHTFYIPNTLKEEWRKRRGFSDLSQLNRVNNYDDEVEKITIDCLHLGDYYKNRNFVIFFYPIYATKIDLGTKNDFLFYLLEEFGKEILRIKIKVVDVSKKLRGELIDKFLSEIKKTLITFHSSVREKLGYIEEHRSKELGYLTEVKQLQEQIKVLKGTHKCLGENIERKIAEIKKLPFVRRVGISSLGIRVDFIHIDLEWNGKKVPLGECYFYINPSRLVIKNKDFVKLDGEIYHSPHISDNAICFGTGKDKAYELLASMKFKELVYFIYLYLKTYNEGDTYISLPNWVKCKECGGEWEGNEDDEEENYDD